VAVDKAKGYPPTPPAGGALE